MNGVEDEIGADFPVIHVHTLDGARTFSMVTG